MNSTFLTIKDHLSLGKITFQVLILEKSRFFLPQTQINRIINKLLLIIVTTANLAYKQKIMQRLVPRMTKLKYQRNEQRHTEEFFCRNLIGPL